jgi:hypothetical protein
MDMNYKDSPFFMKESPFKLGGLVQGIVGAFSHKKKKGDMNDAKGAYDKEKDAFRNLENTNPYANIKNQFADLENTMEDMTVNTQQADFERDMAQQQQANIMGAMSQGGSFDAGNIQALVGAGANQARQASASIGQQEAQNKMAERQQAGANQMAKASGAERVAMAKAAGESERQQREADKQATLMGMAGQEAAAATDAFNQNKASMIEGFGSFAGDALSFLSDRRLKKNIKKVGKSKSGLNVYEFEYKDKSLGKGTYQGVMADEVPKKALIKKGKYNFVNYDAIDVVSKRIR